MMKGKTPEAMPDRQRAMVAAAQPGTGKRHPSDYPPPYPYWLRGKVSRIRR